MPSKHLPNLITLVYFSLPVASEAVDERAYPYTDPSSSFRPCKIHQYIPSLNSLSLLLIPSFFSISIYASNCFLLSPSDFFVALFLKIPSRIRGLHSRNWSSTEQLTSLRYMKLWSERNDYQAKLENSNAEFETVQT